MLNQVTLIGRLTRDPEMKTYGPENKSIAKFSLAVDRPKFGDAEKQVDFIPVTAWRGTADFIGRNFHKGKQVYVSGRLETHTWETEGGEKRYAFEVNARDVGFADSVSKQGGQTGGAPNAGASMSAADYGQVGDFMSEDFDPFNEAPEDDLPF